MRRLLSSLLLTALLFSCASQAQQSLKATKAATTQNTEAGKAASKPPTDATPVIVFRKTPCFGTCPHYEASIYADGRVRYEGLNKYAPVEGKRELKIPVATVNTILAEAKGMAFSKLQDNYTLGASDLPATSLTISPAAGPAKTVTVEEGGPTELKNLFSYIEKQITEGLGASNER